MMHTRSRMLAAALAAGLVAATPLFAQGPVGPRPRDAGAGMPRPMEVDGRGPGPRGDAPFGRGMAGGRGNPAAMLLRLRSQLALTDDQVKRLEALQSAPVPRQNASDLLRARADLMDAMQGDGNLGKARAALDRMSALRNERMIAGLKQRQEARAILTADQRSRLDNMRQQAGRRMKARGLRAGRGPDRMGPGERRWRGGQDGPGAAWRRDDMGRGRGPMGGPPARRGEP